MSRILIVEDEAHLAEGLRFNLEAEGHSVQITDTGEGALKRLLKDREIFDALVLDVMLPGKDGFLVAHELRKAENYTPLLMLTARGRPEDVLKGFESGADDYLPSRLPRHFDRADRELIAPEELAEPGIPNPQARHHPPTQLRQKVSVLMTRSGLQNRQLRVSDQIIPLTMMELNLFLLLIRHGGHPVSRKAILEDVKNLREDTDTRAIDNFIVRLRRYI